jgi:hypothetical protein
VQPVASRGRKSGLTSKKKSLKLGLAALALAGRDPKPEGPEDYEEDYSPDEIVKRIGPISYEEPYSPDEIVKRLGPVASRGRTSCLTSKKKRKA